MDGLADFEGVDVLDDSVREDDLGDFEEVGDLVVEDGLVVEDDLVEEGVPEDLGKVEDFVDDPESKILNIH